MDVTSFIPRLLDMLDSWLVKFTYRPKYGQTGGKLTITCFFILPVFLVKVAAVCDVVQGDANHNREVS